MTANEWPYWNAVKAALHLYDAATVQAQYDLTRRYRSELAARIDAEHLADKLYGTNHAAATCRQITECDWIMHVLTGKSTEFRPPAIAKDTP